MLYKDRILDRVVVCKSRTMVSKSTLARGLWMLVFTGAFSVLGCSSVKGPAVRQASTVDCQVLLDKEWDGGRIDVIGQAFEIKGGAAQIPKVEYAKGMIRKEGYAPVKVIFDLSEATCPVRLLAIHPVPATEK